MGGLHVPRVRQCSLGVEVPLGNISIISLGWLSHAMCLKASSAYPPEFVLVDGQWLCSLTVFIAYLLPSLYANFWRAPAITCSRRHTKCRSVLMPSYADLCFLSGVHSSVEGAVVRWSMFACASVQFGEYGPRDWEREDGVFLCWCLRTDVESAQRKSERGPLLCQEGGQRALGKCSGGQWVYKGKPILGLRGNGLG